MLCLFVVNTNANANFAFNERLYKMNNKKEDMKLTFQVDPSAERGIYSNSVTIFHNETEFLFDFGLSMPGTKPVIKIFSRVITSPQHAKRFLHALSDNIRKYEEKYGIIEDLQMKRPSSPEIIN